MRRGALTTPIGGSVVRAAVAGLTISLASIFAAASATAADIQVFSSGAPAAVQKRLAPAFTKATGHNVVITAETLNAIRKRLAGDAKPDVVVLPRAVMVGYEKSGALRPGSLINLARVGIGIAVKEGAPLPDISTVDALKQTLLNAKSIAHPDPKGGGFTGAHIDRMFERLGIAEAVRPKVMHGYAFTGGVANIAKGVAEIGIFNISEIVPVQGVRLVGPLPAALQNYLVFAGALHVRGEHPAPATAYLQSLTEPSSHDAWKAGGFEALVGGN